MQDVTEYRPPKLSREDLRLLTGPRTTTIYGVAANEPLASPDACRQILDNADRMMRPAGRVAAAAWVQLILRSYPGGKPPDEKIYIRVLETVLADLPADLGESVVDKITRECNYLPSRAQLNAAVQDALTKRRAVIRRATLMLAEHTRRAEESARLATIEAERRERAYNRG